MGEGTTHLPPGFQFFPSDEELVVHFLYRKANQLPCCPHDIVPTLDLHYCDPWELNGKALQGGNQWYFFTHTTQSRDSSNGYWKLNGDDEMVMSDDTGVGVKRTLVFYIGEAPEGIKTNWIMHEYHLLNSCSSTTGSSRRRSSKKRGNSRTGANKLVICRVYESSGGGYHDGGGAELSCLDEVFLSLDDLDEVGFPN